MKKISKFLLKHKLAIIIIIALCGGGYYFYRSKNKTASSITYVLGKVEKGAIITSVSGTGQVSSSNQLDIKPKISADIVAIKVKTGQNVKAGEVLAQLESKDLTRQVTEAKNSLDIAKANLNLKLAGPTKEDIEVAKKSVEASKISYENSLLNLENAKKNAEENLKKAQLAVTNAQMAVDNVQREYEETLSSKNASNITYSQNLIDAYDDAKITINSCLVILRSSLVAADNILNTTNLRIKNLLGILNPQALSDAQNSYYTAKKSLEDFEKVYNETAINWEQQKEEDLLNKSLVTLGVMKDLEHNIYTVLMNTVTTSDLSQTTLDGYKQSISSQETSLVSNINSIQSAIQTINDTKLSNSSSGISSEASINSAKASIDTAKNSLVSAQNSLRQAELDNSKNIASAQSDINIKKNSYESSQAQFNLKIAKPRAVDIASLRVQISQAQNSYSQALENLNNAKIISPIDGIVAKMYQNVGDATSPSNPIVTVITQKQMAIITLNEVDTAKVKAGQKVNLTFSAIDGLTITGEVAEIENIGTVTQGVVSFSIKIVFDMQDDRVKPQMSVAAIIITDQKLDTLIIPNSALKSENNTYYVEIFSASKKQPINENEIVSEETPEKKYVEIGLVNDTNTEILSGLQEGESIVIRIINNNASTQTQSQQSGLRMFGGGGGTVRMGR